MKALVKYATGVGNMEIREVPEPSPGFGEVKIEVKATGICGSDLHTYHGNIGIPMKLPVVTGHEFAGVVVEVGEGVEGIEVGERVTAETTFSTCGRCIHCLTGSYNLCLQRRGIGYWLNGAFAKYTVVPAIRVHKLPDNVDFIGGALSEPLACVVHGAMELTGVSAGDVVLVTGPGAIGLLTMQVAKAEGEAAQKAADAGLKHAKTEETMVKAQVLANTPPDAPEKGNPELEMAQAQHDADLSEREFEHKRQLDVMKLGQQERLASDKLRLQAQENAQQRADQRALMHQQAAMNAQRPDSRQPTKGLR